MNIRGLRYLNVLLTIIAVLLAAHLVVQFSGGFVQSAMAENGEVSVSDVQYQAAAANRELADAIKKVASANKEIAVAVEHVASQFAKYISVIPQVNRN